MLSYKKWKKLNESLLGAPLTLGIKSPASVGNLHSEMGGMEDMGGMGNGGVGAMLRHKKKKRPPMGNGEDFGDEEDIDMDDEELEDDEDIDIDDDELEDDEEFEDEEDEFGDEEDEEDDGFPRKKKPMMAPPMGNGMGEQKCPPTDDDDEEDEEEVVVDDDDEVEDDEEEIEFQKKKMGSKAYQKKMKSAAYQKKNGKKKKMGGMGMGMPHAKLQKKNQKKNQKKMTKEEVEFLNSLKQQTGATKFAIGESGFWMPVKEDALIAPTDPNAGVIEPGPGEVGYAPQGRIG